MAPPHDDPLAVLESQIAALESVSSEEAARMVRELRLELLVRQLSERVSELESGAKRDPVALPLGGLTLPAWLVKAAAAAFGGLILIIGTMVGVDWSKRP